MPAISIKRVRRGASGLGVIIGLLSVFSTVTSASAFVAEAPRWDIISTSNPTNLVPNSPRNEVQDVTVNATQGSFTLGTAPSTGVPASVCHNSIPEFTAPIPYNAIASEVQSALEASGCVGVGGVTVTGGPGGINPYVVTFVGEHDDRPVPLMITDGSSLTGGAATVTATEATRGEFPPSVTVTAINVGGASTDGSTITLSDSLPLPLTAVGVSGYDAYASTLAENGEGSSAMTCSSLPAISCTYAGSVDPGDMLIMTIPVDIAESNMTSVPSQVTVDGGGAAEVSITTPIEIGDTSAPFGPAPGSVIAATSTDQAGAHPNVTTMFTLATSEPDAPVTQAKDIRFDLPPGLVGNTVGMPRCTMGKILELEKKPKECPSDTLVGMAVVTINTQNGAGGGYGARVIPVYNIAPAPGEPAAFGFDAIKLPVRLDTSVLSNGDYGVRVTAPDLTEAASALTSAITIWGIPADHSGPGQDKSLFDLFAGESFGGSDPGQTRVPLLTNPQQCSEPLSATMSADPWTDPDNFANSGPVSMGTLTGCNQLSLESSFTMLPDTLEAGAPAGYSFDLNVPQRNEPDGLATPNVKDVKLMLPAGVVVSPSAAWGLKACSSTQFFGPNEGRQEPATPAECPREAQIGKIRVKSPALEEALEGEVYLGEPECDPCTPEDAQDGKMVRLFLQVISEGEGGIIVKLAGKGEIDQQTGQITTAFENDPQLPFSSLKLELGGGPRATLANPRTCGPVTSNLDLTPWSAPFTSDSTPFYNFEVNQGCFGSQFRPSFAAGLTNLQAGGYGPFTLSFGRSDQDQLLGGLELHMPPGLLGSLAHVPLCAEPQAAQGTCSQQSSIGHIQVLTGPGADPFLVTGGQVFLTEGYKGAPFGLSILVPAVAGPYTLSGTTGRGTVVVRAALFIDPHTAALTVKSDPLPTSLDGIPLQLKVVNVTIDRPQFTFAPTSCARQQVTGILSSVEGISAQVVNPFQVTNCPSLAFKPKFTAATSGRTSKADGASLSVKLSYPNAPQGAEANIHSVKVDLPKQLPSRLTTLQQACTAATFEANPAGCPAASVVGYAKAITPLLPVPVEGPAYFVSHGGEAFPSLILVLQGYGVRIDLVGTTFISKAGITSSTFKAIPDVPVGSFELTLPEGKFSALAANGSLCQTTKIVTVRRRLHGLVVNVHRTVEQAVAQTLQMPTAFVAQNGAELKQSTKIAVTGCPKKAKQVKRKVKRASRPHGRKSSARSRLS
jgi:hypothetical protein